MAITSNFTWTWLKGSDQAGQAGTYGIKGSAATGNTPGARFGQIVWNSPDGNFYMFGGMVAPTWFTFFNDLWKYNPADNTWTWIAGTSDLNQPGIYTDKGMESLTSYPGSRADSASTVGFDGNLYIFGGLGPFSTGGGRVRRNDLWRFNPTNSRWTWLSGSDGFEQLGSYGPKNVPSPSIFPGARNGSVLWATKDNMVYLFGGAGIASTPPFGHLNDLWRFNLSDKLWTWVSGSDQVGQFGNYGSQNVPASTNFPGARNGAIGWYGKDGALYLFGGERTGADPTTQTDSRNDVWRFTPSDNLWTWIKGSSNFDQNGVYGTQNIPSDMNTPGARSYCASWVSRSGQLLLFGGLGFPQSGGKGFLDDLWMFDTDTKNWVWIKGSKVIDQLGSYGTQGVPSDGNNPRSRTMSKGIWTGADDALYLFGGLTKTGISNDLWKGTMPCDFSISDAYTFPATITSNQPFNINWQLNPTIFPINYQATVSFKGSDYTNVFTGLTGSISLPGQPVGVYSDIQLKLVSRSVQNCSDKRSLTATVIDGATLSLLLSFLPSLIVFLILVYLGMIMLFIYDQYALSRRYE